MPEICRFYGIVIQIYYGDHPPAHFHALYGEEVAKIAIETLQIIEREHFRNARWFSFANGREFTNKSCSMRSSVPQPFSRPGKLHRLSKILAGQ